MWFTKRRIYADAAAGMPLSRAAAREWRRLSALFGNPGGLHREAADAKRELEHARERIAHAVGAHADEIFFTGSGTEANTLALEGVLRPLLRSGGIRAVTSSIEHPSVLEPLYALQAYGLEMVELPVDQGGLVSPENAAEAAADAALLSIQLVNSEVGTIEPVREMVKAVRRRNPSILVHTDAAQAPLWLPLNVEKLGVDLMTIDAQKVGGPRGIGALYVRRGTLLEPVVRGGGQEAGLRSGTPDVASAGAFAVAFEEAQRRAPRNTVRVAARREYLFSLIIKHIPDCVLNGPSLEAGARVANNLSVSVPRLDSQMAVISLDALGIAASTRSACSAGEEEPSHVMQALGMPAELAGTAIRFSFLPEVSYADMRRIARALQETALRYRASR